MRLFKVLSVPPCDFCAKPVDEMSLLHGGDGPRHEMHTSCFLLFVEKSPDFGLASSCPYCRDEIDLSSVKKSTEVELFNQILWAYHRRVLGGSNNDGGEESDEDQMNSFLSDLFGGPYLPNRVERSELDGSFRENFLTYLRNFLNDIRRDPSPRPVTPPLLDLGFSTDWMLDSSDFN